MWLTGAKLYLEHADLLAAGVPENTVWSSTKRYRDGKSKSWANVTDPRDGRCCLVDYDTIPEATISKYSISTKAELLAQLKNEQTQLKQLELSVAGSALVGLHAKQVHAADYTFFFTRAGLTNTPDATVQAKATELTQAAGWLRLLAGLNTARQLRQLGFAKKEDLRAAVLTEVEPLNLYGLRVSNVRVLRQKETAFAQALAVAANDVAGSSVHAQRQLAHQRALLTLVPKRYGKANAQKIGKKQGGDAGKVMLGARVDGAEWHANAIIYLFINPGKGNKFDLKEVYRRYCRRCAEAGQAPVSLSGMKAFLQRDEVRLHTAWERDGHAKLEAYLPHQRRERPTYSLSKGGYDGFSVDFYTAVGKAAVMLTVVAVFDYHSEAITGFAVGLVENGVLVRDMYRNHLAQLGGKSYIEIESDRFSGNVAGDTQQLFRRACQHVTRPVPNDPRGKAPNPKARLVERLLAEVNRLTQSIPNWKGTNITAIDPQRKPNPDYASGPVAAATLELGIQQINRLIALYNHQEVEKWDGQTRWARLLADLNPEAPHLDDLARATLLSQHTVTTVRHALVSITVNKKVYEYEFPAFNRYTHLMGKGLKVRVYYDETDLREVTLFGFTDAKDTGTDMYLTTLKQGQRVQMAKAEQTPGDLVLLGQKEQQRAALRDGIDRKQLELEAVMYALEVPAGISLKALRALVAGARLTATAVEDFDTRHGYVLNTPAAQQQMEYYDDRLLRDHGMRVPVPVAPPAKPGLSARDRMNAYKGVSFD